MPVPGAFAGLPPVSPKQDHRKYKFLNQ